MGVTGVENAKQVAVLEAADIREGLVCSCGLSSGDDLWRWRVCLGRKREGKA